MPDGRDHVHEHRRPPSHTHEGSEPPEMTEFGIEAFGVGIVIAAPVEILPGVHTVLPPGWRAKDPADDDDYFFLMPHENQVYTVVHGDESVSGSSDVQIALEVLGSQLRALISVRAPDHVFVHAGVVGYGGRAIVIPGSSFSGKTTLVAELVRAGATYYSDEYAVLDEAGLVHPYAKPLSIRSGGVSQVDHSVEAIGGSAGTDALEIGLVVVSSYSPGAVWTPRQLSSGEAVLAVLEHTIPAQERPQQAMATITKAVQGAVALQGERGEASPLVPELLASVSGAGAPSA